MVATDHHGPPNNLLFIGTRTTPSRMVQGPTSFPLQTHNHGITLLGNIHLHYLGPSEAFSCFLLYLSSYPQPAQNCHTGTHSSMGYIPMDINQAMHSSLMHYFPLKHHLNNASIVGNGNMISVHGHR